MDYSGSLFLFFPYVLFRLIDRFEEEKNNKFEEKVGRK